MRPRRLWIQGLRSYRQPTEIDFTQDGLLAIVGDTGAGKSSILEAITYALYNATTWDQRNVKALIADGMPTMVVELVFAADGHTYRIKRSTSVGSSPAPMHLLTCEDDPDHLRADGEASVAAEVRRLVGLDYSGFKAAVLLPQGQFDQLLHSPPGARTNLLKGIFRLDDLERVRVAAGRARDESQELLLKLRSRRADLRTDPAGDLARAEAAAARHAERITALTEVRDTVQAHAATERGHAAEAQRLRAAADVLAKANTAQTAGLAKLREVDATIRAEIDRLTEECATWDQRHRAAVAQLAAAEREGRTAAVLHRARSSLEQAKRLEELAEDRGQNAEEWRKRSQAASTRVAELAQSIEELEVQLATRQQALTEARTARETAQQNLNGYVNHVRVARDDAKRLAIALTQRQALAAELRRRREQELPALERAHGDAEVRLRDADAGLERLRRDHAAHAAAVGLRPGDPCPVCEQPLPADWTPPPEGDLERAQDAQTKAKREEAKAAREVARLSATLEAQEKSVGALDASIEEQKRTLDAHTAELREVAPEFDPEREDTDGLDDHRSAVARAEGVEKSAGDGVAATRVALTKARSDIQAEERERGTADEQIATITGEIARHQQDAEAALSKLPSRLRPDRSFADPFAGALERVGAELAGVEAQEQSRSDARNHLDRLDQELRKAEQRRSAEVTRPAQQALGKVGLLLQRLRDASADLGGGDLADPDPDAGLDALTMWAASVESAATAGVTRLHKLASDAADQGDAARRARQAAVVEGGFEREEDLEAALNEVKVAHGIARRDADDSRAQIEPAAELDRAIESGGWVVANLGQLAALLADGKFVAYVVQRRQLVLLELASEILLSVTGGRYGFTEKFEIVDSLSNRTRPAKTLSGGETFLASLSLALGLVEMAGRAGGKLDALFLDEGFGNLDTNALDDAMSALERRASEGKLVCVISHIKAVAERIEHVLLVTRTARGSEVRVVDRSERGALMDEELEAGLLQ